MGRSGLSLSYDPSFSHNLPLVGDAAPPSLCDVLRSFRRRISDTPIPAYRASLWDVFRRSKVASAIPVFRQISPTGAPPSACLTAKAICPSLERFFGILGTSLSQGHARNLASHMDQFFAPGSGLWSTGMRVSRAGVWYPKAL